MLNPKREQVIHKCSLCQCFSVSPLLDNIGKHKNRNLQNLMAS
uniref:Uncharacterized protein n=1 Tax=Lotus japonicus TaxID=34305 RepID=I3SHE1_LOTJA|nr:unknown [Lotus japonicus]